MTVSNDTVYAPGKTLTAIDPSNRNTLWTFQLPGSVWLSTPTVYGDTVYTGTFGAETIYALDRQDGSVRWKRSPESKGYWKTPSPTIVTDPEDGDSVGSRVALGTFGHHDTYARWAANQTIADPEDGAIGGHGGAANGSDDVHGEGIDGTDASPGAANGTDAGRGLPGFTGVVAALVLVATVISRAWYCQ